MAKQSYCTSNIDHELPKLQLKPDVVTYLQETFVDADEGPSLSGDGDRGADRLENLLHTLGTPPLFTTLRINSRRASRTSIKSSLQKTLSDQYDEKGQAPPSITEHPSLPDILVVSNRGPLQMNRESKEVVVSLICGMSVLRGADVFAQGIMGAPVTMQAGDAVSVYADVEGACRKGWTQTFDGVRLFVGNGKARISRQDLFCSKDEKSGVGIEMTEPLYCAPSLSGVLPELIFPQNLPSIVCAHVLDPRPGERVLDMCAAPGGKTTHIATLMNDTGCVVALDKSEGKVSKVRSAAAAWGLSCVQAFPYDARRCLVTTGDEGPNGSPPFLLDSFDRILVDAPCSALGQRPSTRNSMTGTEVRSYPALQAKILHVGVKLLKLGGTLVYSTCTVTRQENEDQVATLLHKFPELRLEPQVPHIGGPGITGSLLTEDERRVVQRFDPSIPGTQLSVDTDTIGFFCAKFIKLPR